MPTGPGGLDANGVWQYGEDDTEALASDLLNLGMGSVSTVVGGLGAPTILQVVSTTKTDTFSTTSTSFADVTGLTASITPASTSSKIMAFITMSSGSDATRFVNLRLMRDAVPISVGDAAGSRSQSSSFYFHDFAAGDNAEMHNAAINFLDSPATTSAVTYKMQLKTNAGTIYVNRTAADGNDANNPRLASTITLMEVAG